MTTQSQLSKIILAAALGAGSTAYAAEGGNDMSTWSANSNSNSSASASASAIASAKANANSVNTTSNSYTTSVYTNFNNPVPAYKIIHQPHPVITKGFLTDTIAASRIFEIEEVEFEAPAQTQFKVSDATQSTDVSTKALNVSPALVAKRVINTYEEVELCEGNMFYGKCETHRSKIESLTRPAPEAAPAAP